MPYGLTDEQMLFLRSLFAKNERIERVLLYGSRAKGTYKPFSDVDITIVGKGLTVADIDALHAALNGSVIPYKFDIYKFDLLTDKLPENYNPKSGITIYQRNP